MELEDCGFDLLVDVVTTSDPTVAFQNIDVLIGLGAFPRGPGNAAVSPRTPLFLHGAAPPHALRSQRQTPAHSRASALACVRRRRAHSDGWPALTFFCACAAGMERKDLLAKNVNIFKVLPSPTRGGPSPLARIGV